MAFADHFSEKSATYAQARPTYPDALYAFVAGAAPARDRVWDCATGNGQAAIGLARHFTAVEATDASAQQVANAIAAPGVRYSVQPAESTTFAPASFDAVCVAQALHWFDLERFYAEVRRVLRPGGVIAAWGYGWSRISSRVDQALERHMLAKIEPFWPPENALIIAGYRTIAFPFQRVEAPAFRIELQWTLAQLIAYTETWSATRRYVAEHGRGIIDDTTAALRKAWGADEPRTVTMDIAMLCGRHGAA